MIILEKIDFFDILSTHLTGFGYMIGKRKEALWIPEEQTDINTEKTLKLNLWKETGLKRTIREMC